MNRRPNSRYFDLSTLFALGLGALLLISMPGGCGDSEEADDEGEISSEEIAEPTAPAMMEIVDPEPGDLNNVPPAVQDDADPPADDADGAPEAENGAPDGIYVVQQGDTLYGIAVQFNVSMEALLETNGMDDPNMLQVGQELEIPQ